MKKRILALLLAGVIMASCTSCVSTGKRPDPTDPNGGEPTVTTGPDGTVDPVVTYVDVDDTVYTTEKTKLYTQVGVTTGAVEVSAVTKFHRVKKSTTYSVVEYNEAQYYVQNSAITTDDLTGESFTPCADTVMYVNSPVNIRKYASPVSSFSPVIEELKLNDTVTVIAKGESWYMIKYTEDGSEKNYFVNAKYLSENKVVDYSKEDYTPYFDYLAQGSEKTVYVVVNSVNLRIAPVVDPATLCGVALKKGTAVTLVATGKTTGEYKNWGIVSVADEVDPGATPTYTDYYVKLRADSTNDVYLSDNQNAGGSVSLDDMIAEYGFTKLDKETTMYATGSVYVRSTPAIPEDNSNMVGALKIKDTVIAVAVGTVEGIRFQMIKWENADKTVSYCFVSAKLLTTDSEGKPLPTWTLESLLKENSAFTKLTTSYKTTAKGATICYSAPDQAGKLDKQLAANEEVTIVATGTVNRVEWVIFLAADGYYYMAGASMFNAAA